MKIALRCGASFVAVLGGLLASPSFAQTTAQPAQVPLSPPSQAAEDDAAGTADIVVTAQKFSERASEVPMSITAVGGAELDRRGITSVADLVKITPGLTVATTSASTPVYTIRGIGFYENSLAVSPAVSVYTDQVPLPYSIMTEGASLDVQRVEVLKGPQGTLFGQNSTGGAINYIPNRPTRDFAAGAEAGYGNYNDVTAKGFVSGPITSTLGVRLAGTIERRDGWQRSQTRPGDRLGRRDFSAGRALFYWTPASSVRFELNLNGWVNHSQNPAAQLVAIRATVPTGYQVPLVALAAYQPAPRDNEAADWNANTDYSRNDRFRQAALRTEIDLSDKVTVTSITSVAKLRRNSRTDADGTPYINTDLYQIGTIKSFSQELRLSGTIVDDRLRWIIGGNYADDRSREQGRTTATGTNSRIGPIVFDGVVSVNNQDITTKAVFGSIDFKVTDALSIQGAARYTDSDNDHSGCGADLGSGLLSAAFTLISRQPIPAGACVTLVPGATGSIPSITPIRNGLKEDNVSWRGGLSWNPARGTVLYANVTRGYKSGSFASLPAASVAQLSPVPQESLLAYEAGVKAPLAGRFADIALSVFHYDYDNKQLRGYQLVAPFGNLPALVTIPKSRVNGVELSLNLHPSHGFDISVGGTYLDSKVTRDFTTQDPDAVPVNVRGERFPFTPKWQITSDFQYGHDVGNGLNAFVGVSPRYQSNSSSAFGRNPTYVLGARTIVDARIGVSADADRWRVEVWAKNLTNKFYVENVLHVVDTVVRQVGMPVTYGARVGFRF